MKYIALRTEDGEKKGKIAFYCSVLGVSRQGFYQYLTNRDRPWKYQALADAMLEIVAEDACNDIEKIEKSRNARLARAIIVALPKEIDAKNHIAMVRQYVQEYFVKSGMCADVSIHDKGDGNPHAHILLTTRPLDCAGRWMGKQHRNYLLDKNGERIFDPAKGRYKLGRSIKTHNWDDSDRVQEWRAGWAKACNAQFRQYGIDKEVTCLSYARQGIDREPTKHLGAKVRAMEERGVLTDRGNDNRRIIAERQRLDRQQFRQRMEQSRARNLERDFERGR